MRPLLIPLLALLLLSCASTVQEVQVQTPAELSGYEKEILEWQQARNDRLDQPDGWLTLSGLYWLNQGENSFGSAEGNDLVFPNDSAPAHMGVLMLEADSVSFSSHPGVELTVGDSLLSRGGLRKDISGSPDILKWQSLSWYIIQRGERIGVRLKDSENPNYVNFKPTELFAIDSSWRIPAKLLPFDTTTTIDIVNVLGDTSPNPTPGILHFDIDGKNYELTPIAEPGDDSYFIIFSDATSGVSTYGAGRFLVVPAADEQGITIIDFNRSYNMPCVFSPYATCPLPPPENMLKVAIEAGELDYHLADTH